VAAATTATGSPMYRTRSAASTGMVTWSSARPPLASSTIWFLGTSAAVSTAKTPGSARAELTSMPVIRALGTGLRTRRPCSMPGRRQSAA